MKFWRKFREYLHFNKRFLVRQDLHHLMDRLPQCQTFESRIEWLVYFFAWLRLPHSEEIGTSIDPQRIPSVRFKYVLNLLDKNPDLKKHFFEVLSLTLQEMTDVNLYSEVGLSNQVGFIQELSERLNQKFLPETPLRHDLSTLLFKLFPDPEDLVWIDHFDLEILSRLIQEISHFDSVNLSILSQDIGESLIQLGSQVTSLAMSTQFRERMGFKRLSELPFYELPVVIHNFVEARHNKEWDKLQEMREPLLILLNKCYDTLIMVQLHLDEYGVSVSLVFQMERLRRQLSRMALLIDIFASPIVDPKRLRDLTVQLVHDIQSKSGVSTFISDSLSLLTQKVVERNSEIGEHYITRSTHEARKMFRKACGGGAITAVTVYIKFLIVSLGLPFFQMGFLASVNYAISFLAIQFSGFTLATKQPASTAPAMATKLRDLDINQIQDVTEDMLALIRSQFIAVIGNITVVAPVALVIYYFSQGLTGAPPLTVEKAKKVLESTNLVGPSFIYAAFTGFLLFSSSMFAGWFDNWVTFRKLRERIHYNEKFRAVFGREWAQKFANFIHNNAAALAANISLGVMLGLVPEVMKFFGIPLDIRHVTLSSGSLAAAIPVLGYNVLLTWSFWNAFLGIAIIGFLNVFVSFSLAFSLALNAQRVRKLQRNALLLNLIKTIISDPTVLVRTIEKYQPPTPPNKQDS